MVVSVGEGGKGVFHTSALLHTGRSTVAVTKSLTGGLSSSKIRLVLVSHFSPPPTPFIRRLKRLVSEYRLVGSLKCYRWLENRSRETRDDRTSSLA